MIIKSNTPLSDNELRQIKNVLKSIDEINVSFMERVAEFFPYTNISADKDILYIGNPPWDLTQEVTV